MASPREKAKQNWEQAQQIRSEILESLSGLKKERGTSQYTTRFHEAEETIAQFRLACTQVIINDFEYAVAKKVENSLWQCHTFLNGEYRRALSRLSPQNQAVQKRKVDKLYRAFLKISEKFYVFYIQQLHHRFSIPELQQLAHGAGAQTTENQGGRAAPHVPLRSLAVRSCQTTLVHLGDLARYQCQASDKVSKATFDKAVGFYDLANALDPDDGAAHHQLAILYQLVDQHFDIVYHFHRAISISTPHQLALGNLKQEFKNPEGTSQTKKRGTKDRSEAMVSWFIRLHAYLFHGKQFSAQAELEDEVLHRVELALKGEGSESVLLKMILINMAAYDISTENVKALWTMEGSQSCQFLLRFNVRMVLTLLRVLERTLRDEDPAPLSPEAAAGHGDSGIQFSQGLLKLLPLLRLYVGWIYAVRADLVQYQDYLEPQIQEVYGLLADVLTSLNLFVDPTIQTVSSKYLLPEDTEAQGLRPLGDRKLPLFFYSEEQQSPTASKRAKVRKPQQKVFGKKFGPEIEAIWRIRDIVSCGVFLAGSATFPLGLASETHEGRDVEAWKFVDGAAVSTPNEATLSRLLRKLGCGDLKKEPGCLPEEEASQPETNASTNGHVAVPASPEGENVPQPAETSRQGKGPAQQRAAPCQVADPSEDTEMVNMVNKLLGPLDGDRPQSSDAPVEPSYGMHSSTANEIFGGLDVSPAQPSPVSKTIPSLPWDYFYKPTPHRSNSQEQNQPQANGHNVPRSAAASSPYLGELSASYDRVLPHGFSPRLDARHLQTSPSLHTPSPSLPRRDYGRDSLEGSRNAVLDHLKSALLAQHGLSRDTASPANGNFNNTNVSQLWANQSTAGESQVGQSAGPARSLGLRRNDFGSYDERSIDYRAGAANSPNMADLGRPVMNTGAGYLAPSGSNTFGGQTIWGSGPSPTYHQRASPWQTEASAPASSIGFSHPSSLFVGTPGAVPAAPVNAVACNGNYYNGSTPFGRLGEGVNNREDPTHFRNQLKAVTGTSELSYDQQIMQAAMMDDHHKPRPK